MLLYIYETFECLMRVDIMHSLRSYSILNENLIPYIPSVKGYNINMHSSYCRPSKLFKYC